MPLSAFFARYDGAALRPPAPLSSPQDWYRAPDEQATVYARLRQWCLEGSGVTAAGAHGSANLRMPFAAAEWTPADGSAALPLVEALCQDLDGSVQLAARPGSLARLQLRLRVKINDCLGWRPRRDDDPWDSGYASAEPDVLPALRRFRPRRPTFIVASHPSLSQAAALVETLSSHQREFSCAVRLLLLDVRATDGSRADGSAITDLDTLRIRYGITRMGSTEG